MEHIHKEKFDFVMREILRVTKPRGKIDIYCPHFTCGVSRCIVEHLTPISYFTINKQKFKEIDILERQFNPFRESFPYRKLKIGNILKFMNFFLRIPPNIMPFIYERFWCWYYPVEEVEFKIVKK